MNPSIEPPRRNLTGAIVPALAAAALAGLGALIVVGAQQRRDPLIAGYAPQGCILNDLTEGGPIALRDENGNRVTQADFSSGPAVIYFGFTHCPDVCPTTLYTLGEALRAPGGYDIQPIMITVDPARDTPALMNAYVDTEGFPEGLVGLSGSQAEVEAAISSFDVVARRAPIQGGSAAEYNMDHTSFLYVMDENWRLRAKMLSIGAQPADVAACIAAGLGAPT